ncbi:hypothetical protein EGJ09_04885 [Pseudomonas sp. p106]|nr:hypothetical protein EGJ09_04885 [Pseudomonas sp. p106]
MTKKATPSIASHLLQQKPGLKGAAVQHNRRQAGYLRYTTALVSSEAPVQAGLPAIGPEEALRFQDGTGNPPGCDNVHR